MPACIVSNATEKVKSGVTEGESEVMIWEIRNALKMRGSLRM
jgi:hypothetical protein